jgi:CubicO group peptidase (beta-lactamase class C family)
MRRRLLLSASLAASLPVTARARDLAELAKQYRVPDVCALMLGGGPDEVFQAGRDAPACFQAASISKVIAGLTVMRLVEERKLGLDTPVNELLRSWKLEGPGSARVTPRLLLAHRGGTNVPGFPGYAAGVRLPTLVEILDGAPPANTPRVRVERPPGSRFVYSGGGTTVLQQIVADVAGKPFAEAATERVLRPAGMDAAYLTPPGPSAKAHDADGRVLPGDYHRYPELAAAGLWCTARDLAKLIRAFGTSWRGDGPLVSAATARLMATPVDGGPTGLGVFVDPRTEGVPLLSHYGVNAGFRSVIAFAADGSFGTVIMTDGEGGRWLIPELGQSLFDGRKLGRFPRLA